MAGKGKIKSKGSILVICSHSDDQVIGAGGAIAKYAREGYDIHTIILSFGEGAKPHIRREVISRTRVKEAQKADKIIGGKGVVFLGLKELHFEEDFEKRGMENNFKEMIRKLNPVKIFTHASDDAHPDHRATFRMVLKIYKRLGLKSELYMFEVWHLLNLRKRSKPKLVIDTSDTFKTKIAALKAFKSQIDLFTFYNYLVLNNFFFFLIYIKDTLNGIKYSTKYAEVFYKVR
ncbi:MAG TPA: PIG-L deacetylase family protein [Candidatus Nanoarchaeia archaeon]|nr:PIG-L deacetylase family protein [Candidatus Nanoarchaeia archaeon]